LAVRKCEGIVVSTLVANSRKAGFFILVSQLSITTNYYNLNLQSHLVSSVDAQDMDASSTQSKIENKHEV
jgi:hypothetical protein